MAQRAPLAAAAWFDRGDIAMRLERYDQALTDFRTAANLAPGLAGYRLREATLLYQQGEPEEAKTMMRGIARKYPGYAGAGPWVGGIALHEARNLKSQPGAWATAPPPIPGSCLGERST